MELNQSFSSMPEYGQELSSITQTDKKQQVIAHQDPSSAVVDSNPVNEHKEMSIHQQNKFLTLFMQHRRETITYYLVFWSFGMCVALLGPTLMDLGCKTSNMFSTMSWAFFSQSLCTLLGSASGGLFVQRYGAHPILLIASGMLAFTLSVIALCDRLWLLALVLGVMGFFMGTIDTVANLSMLALYGSNVAPFLQALHFFYGLGAFLSPLISMPFLVSDDCASGRKSTIHKTPLPSPILQTEINSTLSVISNVTMVNSVSPISEIQYAFWIMALLQLPVILMVASLIAKDMSQESASKVADEYLIEERGLKPSQFPADILRTPQNEFVDRPPVTSMQTSWITGLTALLLFLNDGLQASFGGYVYSYAVKSMAYLSIQKAAYLNACFWGTFAFGRLLSIWFATRLSPVFMLFCNICGCLCAMLMMVIMPHNHVMLYAGTCVFGMFLSSVYPTAISLADIYIKLTSPITTVIVVAAAAGEMSMPVIVGHEFDVFGPMSFLVTELVITMASVLVFVALLVMGTSILRPTAKRGVCGAIFDCIPHPSREAQEDSLLMRHEVKYYSRMRSDLSETNLDQRSHAGEYCHQDLKETSLNFQEPTHLS